MNNAARAIGSVTSLSGAGSPVIDADSSSMFEDLIGPSRCIVATWNKAKGV